MKKALSSLNTLYECCISMLPIIVPLAIPVLVDMCNLGIAVLFHEGRLPSVHHGAPYGFLTSPHNCASSRRLTFSLLGA